MLYILSNVKKSTDVGRVAAVILDQRGKMFRLKRLMEQLIKKLQERKMTLNSDGLELLSVAFFIAANEAQEERDYATCKYYCSRFHEVLLDSLRSKLRCYCTRISIRL
jgi:hypothetical protein